MCGIAGGIRHIISEPERQQVRQRLLHRGPDDSGFYQNDQVWLLNTRLSIQDLSQAGHQPMQTPDGRYTLVFNGEIYNHWELRKTLSEHGINYRSSSDTETLLRAYVIFGHECLKMLHGDYAFAIYDSQERTVFIARDPVGVKPLYYYADGKQLLFASEIKALLVLQGLDYSIAPNEFANYLTFLYSPSDHTPFRNIKKLAPGHFLRASVEGPFAPEQIQYFRLPFGQSGANNSETDLKSALKQTLQAVVESQLQSDAPLGLMLSGGLDSSLIAALTRRVIPHTPLHAFTINTSGGMETEGFEEDNLYAQLVAKCEGITLHEVDGALDIATELDSIVHSLDEPLADPAGFHTAHIAKAAHQQGIKVLLSGTGADDMFSGYRRHLALSWTKAAPFLPAATRRILNDFAGLMPESNTIRRLAKLAVGAGLRQDHAIIALHFWISPARVQQLFQKGSLQDDDWQFRSFEALLHEIPNEKDALQKALFWEQRTFLPHHNLAYMDKMGMRHSVEIRSPFADARIASFAAQLPSPLKLCGGVTKYLLREIAKDYLPQSIIKRSKTGFGAPLRSWMKGPLAPLIRERILDESFLRRGIFDKAAIEQLIADNARGRIDGAYTLFSLLTIESWLRQFASSE